MGVQEGGEAPFLQEKRYCSQRGTHFFMLFNYRLLIQVTHTDYRFSHTISVLIMGVQEGAKPPSFLPPFTISSVFVNCLTT
jgi:hypothetical protein